MRWSTYTNRDGDTRAAVWRDGRLHPAPAGVGLVDLLGDDVRAVEHPGSPDHERLAHALEPGRPGADHLIFEEEHRRLG